MTKQKHTANRTASIIFISTGILLILLAVVASFVIDVITIETCEKTPIGGCMYGDALRSIVYIFVICGLLGIMGISSIVIGLVKGRK